MKLAFVTTDNREAYREYAKASPFFGAAPEAVLAGFAARADVEVHVLSCTQRPLPATAKLGSNVFYHSLHVQKFGWMRTGYQGCIRAIRRQVQAIKPDLVHGQGTERECALGAVFSGFPNVVTVHGNMAGVARLQRARPLSFYWLAERLENLALRRAGGVFCNSEYTEEMVTARAKRTWRIPNAVRLPFFESPSNLKPSPIPVFLNVGVVCPWKQQIEVLNWARGFHQAGHRFEMRFVGHLDPSSSYGEKFAALLREATTEGYARHIAPLDVSDLIAEFDSASALIHFPTEESFGLVVAEALARDLPVFGARTGGVRDILQGIKGATLLDPGDWRGLTDSVRAWLERDAPRAEAAAEMARRYHPTTVVQAHIDAYRELLQRS